MPERLYLCGELLCRTSDENLLMALRFGSKTWGGIQYISSMWPVLEVWDEVEFRNLVPLSGWFDWFEHGDALI